MTAFLEEFGRARALKLIGEATKDAARAALNAGLPVTFARNGELFREFPDGHIKERFAPPAQEAR